MKNNYSEKEVNKAIRRRRRNNQTNASNPTNNNQPTIKYISAPYIKGPSEIMNRVLKKHDIVLSCKPSRTIKNQVCHVKDPIPADETPNVIYKLPCQDCNEVYIGETGRSLKTRKKEHQDRIVHRDANSQVYQHITQLPDAHTIAWNNASIIHTNRNLKQRRFIEAAYSISSNNSYNRRADIHPTLIPLVKNICKSIKHWTVKYKRIFHFFSN